MPQKTSDPALVELRIGAQPDALSWIRFPAPAAADGRALPRRIVHTALIRIPQDGSIRLLRATGVAWTDERLEAAASVLAQAAAARWSAQLLSRQLAQALHGPPVTVVAPGLEGVERAHWDTRNLAVAQAVAQALAHARPQPQPQPQPQQQQQQQQQQRAQSRPQLQLQLQLQLNLQSQSQSQTGATTDAFGTGGAEALSQAVEALHASIVASLQRAHERFFGTLDQEALELAREQGADAQTYNFLVRPPHRRNRIQFARCFPLLVPGAAQGDVARGGAQLCRIVDEAMPFVKALSRAWGVSQGAVRCLLQRPVSLVGHQWAQRPRILLVVLDALRAEDRPTDDPQTWQRFNRIVNEAAEIFGRGLTSTVSRSWISEAMARSRRGQAMRHNDEPFDGEFVAAVEALRRALIETLEHAALRETLRADPDREARARGAADGLLCRLSPKRLAGLAARYQRKVREARTATGANVRASPQAKSSAAAATSAQHDAGSAFWPLLPEPYLSRDGTRRVVSLATRAQLQAHGEMLSNCLAKRFLADYTSQCLRAKSFILGVVSAAHGAPLSTAELQPRRSELRLSHPVLRVVQHTAAHNTAPSSACRAAIDEVAALLETEAYRRHLQELLRKAQVGLDRRRDDEVRQQEDVLRSVIGPARYQAMLATVAAGKAASGSEDGEAHATHH